MSIFFSPDFSSLTLLGIHFPINLSKIPHSLSTAIKSSLRLCPAALHCGQFHTKIILAPQVPLLDPLLVLWTTVQCGIQDFSKRRCQHAKLSDFPKKLHEIKKILVRWGGGAFLESTTGGGANSKGGCKKLLFRGFPPKTAWNWKNLDPEGRRASLPPP